MYVKDILTSDEIRLLSGYIPQVYGVRSIENLERESAQQLIFAACRPFTRRNKMYPVRNTPLFSLRRAAQRYGVQLDIVFESHFFDTDIDANGTYLLLDPITAYPPRALAVMLKLWGFEAVGPTEATVFAGAHKDMKHRIGILRPLLPISSPDAGDGYQLPYIWTSSGGLRSFQWYDLRAYLSKDNPGEFREYPILVRRKEERALSSARNLFTSTVVPFVRSIV